MVQSGWVWQVGVPALEEQIHEWVTCVPRVDSSQFGSATAKAGRIGYIVDHAHHG
jgi:hypothetical protein